MAKEEKKKNEVVPAQSTAVAVDAPDYLKQLVSSGADMGTSELSKFIRPSYIKIVQALTGSEFKSVGGVGSMLLVPEKRLLASCPGEPQPSASIRFTPLFFYPEWCLWNPIQLKGQKPAIAGRTIDQTDPIARLAKNFENRTKAIEGQPANIVQKAYEHLNFLIQVEIDGLLDNLIVVSFAKGGYKAGENLCRAIKARKMPLYTMVFELRAVHDKNNQGNEYYRFDAQNPASDPWRAEADIAELKLKYEGLKEAHAGNKIVVEHDFEDDAAPAGVDPSTFE